MTISLDSKAAPLEDHISNLEVISSLTVKKAKHLKRGGHSCQVVYGAPLERKLIKTIKILGSPTRPGANIWIVE